MAMENQINPASFMNLLLDAICLVDADGRFVFVSAACEQIFGYTPEEMLGRKMVEFIHPEDLSRTLQAASQIMAGQPNPHFENRYLRKNGEVVHIMWSARWSESMQMRVAVARDVTERKQAEAMQAALFAISEAAHSAENLPALYIHIHQIIAGLLPAQQFMVALQEPASRQLQICYPQPAPAGIGSLGLQMLASAQPLLWQCGQQGCQDEPGLHSWLGVPLRSQSGVMGALILKSHDPLLHYTPRHQALLEYVSAQVATAIERKQLYQRLQQMARYDALTGLPNRALLNERLGEALARARRNDDTLALLYLDLDNFKQVNDSLGHSAGDQLLQIAAQRLSQCVRDSDLVARIGGDEFVVLLESHAQPEQVERLAQRIQQAFAAPVELAGQRVPAWVSIGMAHYPQHGSSEQQLLTHADNMMYRHKKQRRDGQLATPAAG